MLKGDVNTFIGDFGLYQLRIFIAVFILAMSSMDSIHIVFIGADMPHWCGVPALDELPYDVQKNVAIPTTESSDGSIVYNSCEMYSLNYSVYNHSQLYSWNRSLMITNETSVISCSRWTYDQSQFTSTIVSKVSQMQSLDRVLRCCSPASVLVFLTFIVFIIFFLSSFRPTFTFPLCPPVFQFFSTFSQFTLLFYSFSSSFFLRLLFLFNKNKYTCSYLLAYHSLYASC